MIKNLTDSGHLFVAAAGNSSVDNDADGSYPIHDLERIISVTSITTIYWPVFELRIAVC